MLLKTCEHGNGLGMCWMCQLTTIKELETDLKEAQALYVECKKELDRLKENAYFYRENFPSNRQIKQLKEKIDRYETALKQYAKPTNWLREWKDDDPVLNIWDKGSGPEIAQEALK